MQSDYLVRATISKEWKVEYVRGENILILKVKIILPEPHPTFKLTKTLQDFIKLE